VFSLKSKVKSLKSKVKSLKPKLKSLKFRQGSLGFHNIMKFDCLSYFPYLPKQRQGQPTPACMMVSKTKVMSLSHMNMDSNKAKANPRAEDKRDSTT